MVLEPTFSIFSIENNHGAELNLRASRSDYRTARDPISCPGQTSRANVSSSLLIRAASHPEMLRSCCLGTAIPNDSTGRGQLWLNPPRESLRSEERRVGKEGRSRWPPSPSEQQ